MQVKIISITQPLVEGIKTAEELIVHNARVSNPDNQLNTETGAGLIKYCARNSHWSIFEQASMGVEIKTSRAIAAQIIRHKSFQIQEYSSRYSKMNGVEPLEWRLQGKTNRQVGEEEIILPKMLQQQVEMVQDECFGIYNELLNHGIAKECARFILPLNTQTTIYMTGTIRSWIHYFQVRCDTHTQKEHRDIALAIRDIFKQYFPVISEALEY